MRTFLALAAALFACASPSWAAGASPGTSGGDLFMSGTRALTLQARRAGEGYFSPDGRRLVFQSERQEDNPFYQIYVLDLETGDTHRVSPGTGKTTCAFFHPGRDELLFASTHLDPEAEAKQREELEFRASGKTRRYSWDYDETFDIFTAKSNGRGTRRLTEARGYDAEGAYSPDGSQIVFCSLRHAYAGDLSTPEERERLEMDPSYFGEIYIMDANGGNVRRLTDWPGYDGGPFFSPDGERIVWRHFDESGALADIYTMRTDASDRCRLTDFESMCWAPYFHPSGRYIIFTSNKHGFSNFELFIVDVEGAKTPVRVTHTDGFDGLPVFSPDGGRIAWTSNRTAGGESQIFIADWEHEAALAALAAAPPRGAADEDLAGRLRDHVHVLAADEMGGRMTGSEGARRAGDYIAAELESYGLQPGGTDGYFYSFPFTSGMEIVEDRNEMMLRTGDGERKFRVNIDFQPLAFTANEDVEGEVVFAGYGLYVSGKLGEGYDSYGDIDVDGKVVVVLRYTPEDVTAERRQELNHYAGLRYKAMTARERGAKGLLVVTGPNSPNAGELIPMRADQSLESSGIAVASITMETAKAILDKAGKDLGEVQSQLDVEDPHFEGTFAVEGVTIRLKTEVVRKKQQGRNVVALLPPADDAHGYVVVGAHYDHIGRGEVGSLAHKGEEGMIHNGADDNASGTAVVLELARLLAERFRSDAARFHRGVVVALWSGEELGIIGSKRFVDEPTVPRESMRAYVNFDMVGRLRDNKLTLQGVASSDAWKPLVEKRNVAAGFNVLMQDDPYQPTDVTAFYPEGIPVMSFFTGSHADYNRPTDDAETLNYEGMERITRFAENVILDLVDSSEPVQYVEVESVRSAGRSDMRVFLGTIPDYTTEGIEGVKLSGVRGGGPADRAGIVGGDIIVELAGLKITNIYDYTYAIDAVKVGVPVDIVVLRGGERLTLKIVPEARQ